VLVKERNMRNRTRKPFVWLIVTLCSAALIGLFFAPALADEAVDDSGATFDVEMDEDSVILDDFEGADLAVEGDESFGRNFQSTWLAAQEFDPMDSGMTWNRGPFGIGSFRCRTGGGNLWFDANFGLPSGARLTIARMFYDDNVNGQRIYLFLTRTRVSEAPGVAPTVTFIGPSGGVSSPDGISRWGNVPITTNTTIANRLDIYSARVNIGTNTCLIGVRLFWQRQIRTGLSNPFSDIGGLPQEFQDSIKALAASGITTGTTPTTYSPFQSVNRGQMATFLARALGLYWDYNTGY
jgi:hypothetical protein